MVDVNDINADSDTDADEVAQTNTDAMLMLI